MPDVLLAYTPPRTLQPCDEIADKRKTYVMLKKSECVVYKMKDEINTLETVSRNIPGQTGRGLWPDTLP